MKKDETETPTILFTGFPGFIGMRLLPRILELHPQSRLECLVQEKFMDAARSAVGTQEAAHPHARGRIGLVAGDIMHGNMSLDQLWSARPVLGHGAYRGPLDGLYMCGAGTHPGGGVSGAAGHNCAREVLADRGLLGRLLARRSAVR